MWIEDNLLRSLEFLAMTDDFCLYDEYEWGDYEVVSILERWLETFRNSIPYLRGIALLLWEMDDSWNELTRVVLWEICERVGIQLQITKLSTDLY